MSGVNDSKFNDAEKKKRDNQILFMIFLFLVEREEHRLQMEKLIQNNMSDKELFEASEQHRKMDERRWLQIMDEDDRRYAMQLKLIAEMELLFSKESLERQKKFLEELIAENEIEEIKEKIDVLKERLESLREHNKLTLFNSGFHPY